MSKFHIFNSRGYQVYPRLPDSESKQASGNLLSLIQKSTPLYVDPTSCQVFVSIEADSPTVRGRNRAHLYAHYEADDDEELFSGLIDELEQIDEKNNWVLFREKARFTLPWLVESATPESPADLKVDDRYLLVIKEALSDGAQLDLGIDSYQSAARAMQYLLFHDEMRISIGVSTEGRTEPLEEAGLVLVPDKSHFHALNNKTSEKIVTYNDKIADIVRETFEDGAIDAINELVESDEISVWQCYSELQSLLDIFDEDRAVAPDVDSESATRAAEFVVAVRRGVTLDGVDPTHVEEEVRTDIERSIRDSVDGHRRELESNISDLVRSKFETQFERIEKLDFSTRVTALRAIQSLIRGEALDDERSLPESVGRVSSLLDELAENEALFLNECRRIKDDLEDRTETRIETLVDKQKSEYQDEFESRFQAIKPDIKSVDSLQRLRQFREELDTLIRILDYPEAEYDIGTKKIQEFQTLVRKVHESDILDTSDSSALLEEFKQEIRNYRSNIRESIQTDLSNRCKEDVHKLSERTATESYIDVYNRLHRAKSVLRSPSANDTDLSTHNSAIQMVDLHPLLTDDHIREIKNDVRETIDNKISNIREEERERIIEKISEVVAALDEDGNQVEKIRELRTFNRFIETEMSKGGFSKSKRFHKLRNSRIKTHIETIIDYYEAEFFQYYDVRQVSGAIQDEVDEKIGSLQEAQRTHLEREFEDLLERYHEILDVQDRVRLFRSLESGVAKTEFRVEGLTEEDESLLASLFHQKGDQYQILDAANRRKLQQTIDERVTREVQSAQETVETNLTDLVLKTLEDEQPSQSKADLDSLTNYRELLKKTENAVMQKRNTSGVEIVDESIQRGKDLLKTDRTGFGEVHLTDTVADAEAGTYEAFAARVSDFVSEKKSDIEALVYDTVESSFDEELNAIANWRQIEQDPERLEAQIRFLQKLGDLDNGGVGRSIRVQLESGRKVEHRLQNPNLGDLYPELPSSRKNRIQSDIDEFLENKSHHLSEEIEERIEEELEQYNGLDNVTRSTDGLANFREYVDNPNTEPPTGRLKHAVESFDYLYTLYNDGLIKEVHFDEASWEVLDFIDEFEEGCGTAGGWRDKIRRSLQPTLAKAASLLIMAFAMFMLIHVTEGNPRGTLSAVTEGIDGDFLSTVSVIISESNVLTIESAILFLPVILLSTIGLLYYIDWSATSRLNSLLTNIDWSATSRLNSLLTSRDAENKRTSRIDWRKGIALLLVLLLVFGGMIWLIPLEEQSTSTDESTDNLGSPSVETTAPGWGNTIDEGTGIPVLANTSADQYTVRLIDSDGTEVDTETGTVEDSSIDVSVEPNASGEHYVVLSVASQGGSSASILRRVTVLED